MVRPIFVYRIDMTKSGTTKSKMKVIMSAVFELYRDRTGAHTTSTSSLSSEELDVTGVSKIEK